MSDKYGAKYFIQQGLVCDLRKKFEDGEILQKSGSGTSLIIDDKKKNRANEVNISHQNLERNIEKIYVNRRESSLLNNLDLLEGTEKSKHVDKVALRRTGSNAYLSYSHTRTQSQTDLELSNVPKRPVPAPRRTISTLNDNKISKNDRNLPDTFHDACKIGRLESFRKKCLSMMDHSINEMKSIGYTEQENSANENNVCYSLENNFSDSDVSDDSIIYENVHFMRNSTVLDIPCKAYDEIFDESATNPPQEDYYEEFSNQNLNLTEVYADKSHQFLTTPTSKSIEFVFDTSSEAHNYNWGAHLPPKQTPLAVGVWESDSSATEIKSRRNTNSNIQNQKITVRCSTSNRIGIVGADSVFRNDFDGVPVTTGRKRDVSSKLTNIIEHLKTTESRYLQELKEVAPVYIYVMKHHTSSEIRSKAEGLCDTIETLVAIQTEFEEALSRAFTLEAVLTGFIDHENLFITYRQFFMENGSETTITIADSKSEFKQEVTLGGILNQRLVHYKMILEDIRKELAGEKDYFQLVLDLLENVTKIINSCNIILLLNRFHNNPWRTNINGSLADVRVAPSSHFIKQYPGDVTGYGEYILKDKFKVTQPLRTILTVFLFSNIIIFTVENPEDVFYYKDHIKIKDIFPLPKGKREKVLKLRNYTASKLFHKDIVYRLEAFDKTVPEIWRTKIQAILWSEKLNLREKSKSKFYKIIDDISEELEL